LLGQALMDFCIRSATNRSNSIIPSYQLFSILYSHTWPSLTIRTLKSCTCSTVNIWTFFC